MCLIFYRTNVAPLAGHGLTFVVGVDKGSRTLAGLTAALTSLHLEIMMMLISLFCQLGGWAPLIDNKMREHCKLAS
jgi:hypothetical protein